MKVAQNIIGYRLRQYASGPRRLRDLVAASLIFPRRSRRSNEGSSMPSVLVWSGAFLPGYKAGGPIKSVASSLDSLDDAEATLITADRDLGETASYPGLSGKIVEYGRGHRVYYMNPRSACHVAVAARLIRSKRWRVVYLNSYWSPVYTLVPLVLRSVGFLRTERVLVAPRGCLAPSALRIKWAKKRWLMWAYRLLLDLNGAVFHATSSQEVLDISKVHPKRTVLHVSPIPPRIVNRSHGGRESVARVVYISRVAPIKNLHLVIEAIRRIDRNLRLDVYGPIENDAYWSLCQRHVSRIGSNVDARFHGPLPGHEVADVLAVSDIFVLPTEGENFGHAIAEALANGCGVVIPDTTPWTEVILRGGGVLIPSLNGSGVAFALNALLEEWGRDPEALSNKVLGAYGEWLSKQSLQNPISLTMMLDDAK